MKRIIITAPAATRFGILRTCIILPGLTISRPWIPPAILMTCPWKPIPWVRQPFGQWSASGARPRSRMHSSARAARRCLRWILIRKTIISAVCSLLRKISRPARSPALRLQKTAPLTRPLISQISDCIMSWTQARLMTAPVKALTAVKRAMARPAQLSAARTEPPPLAAR